MKSIIVLAMVLVLGACSSSSSDSKGGDGKVQTAEAKEFDAVAKGSWASGCMANEQGVNYREIITIKGVGKASFVYNVYPDAQCGGEPQAQGAQELNYTVVRYANGAGELKINDKAVAFSFQNGILTVGQVTFTRIN